MSALRFAMVQEKVALWIFDGNSRASQRLEDPQARQGVSQGLRVPQTPGLKFEAASRVLAFRPAHPTVKPPALLGRQDVVNNRRREHDQKKHIVQETFHCRIQLHGDKQTQAEKCCTRQENAGCKCTVVGKPGFQPLLLIAIGPRVA